jgi:gluconolactonase
MVNITRVDLLALATSYHYNYQIQDIANASTNHVSFISYSETFVNDILGPNPTQELVSNPGWEAFHEAGVYNIQTGKLYAASNFEIGELNNHINVTAIDIHNNNTIESISYRHLHSANGGAAFYPVGTPPDSSEGQKIVCMHSVAST